MRYVLYCELSGDVVPYHKELVRDIAEKFGVARPLRQKFEPHFTLKYGFETTKLYELENLLETFCAQHKRTPVSVGGFNSFDDDVIFLNVYLSDEARKVFLDLLHQLKQIPWITWSEYDGEYLHFHATIAAGCKNHYAEIQDFIKAREASFDCWFDNITIIREADVIDGIQTWETYKRFEMR